MPTPNQNQARIDQLIARVKDHPMCLTLEVIGGAYRVLYPRGISPYADGAQASFACGKILALERLLSVIRRHYQEGTRL